MNPAVITIDNILTVVDELANVSTPTPGAMIVRYGLITELRSALQPNLGQTSTGRGSGNRIPIDPTTMALWETITDRVLALREDLEDAPDRTGSLEQILNGWARDLVAADLEIRVLQEQNGTHVTGLNEVALATILHRLTRIRDLIDHHFNPPRTGDIPNAQCPVCGHDTVINIEDGDYTQKAALGFQIDHNGTVTVTCHNPDCATGWHGWDELQQLRHQIHIFDTT